ncbi:hypothetical protein FPV67DRAFT_1656561 [Lyophyllum atratum]|nr:hypothetical protein FPV67DRAFT_1656561 [Lyophyllum atratum]
MALAILAKQFLPGLASSAKRTDDPIIQSSKLGISIVTLGDAHLAELLANPRPIPLCGFYMLAEHSSYLCTYSDLLVWISPLKIRISAPDTKDTGKCIDLGHRNTWTRWGDTRHGPASNTACGYVGESSGSNNRRGRKSYAFGPQLRTSRLKRFRVFRIFNSNDERQTESTVQLSMRWE